MEFIFLLIAILVTIGGFYCVGRMVFSHERLMNTYKNNAEFVAMHSILAIISVLAAFITLCAFNNTFWHLPYLTH